MVFCQALADIKYCLTLLQDEDSYLIFITLPSVFKIINDHKLFDSNKIIYVPYPKSFFDYIYFFKNYRKSLLKLEQLFFENVYVFSLGFDWISLSILKRTSKKSVKINHIDIYKNLNKVEVKRTLNIYVRIIYYYLLTGVVFRYYTIVNGRNVVVYDDSSTKIRKVDIKHNFVNFINSNTSYQNKIILIDSVSPFLKHSNNKILYQDILDKLEDLGYTILIKKHPNFPMSCDFLRKFDKADETPSELIDLSSSKCVIGLNSAAIVNNNSPLKISLLYLFNCEENEAYVAKIFDYLNKLDKKSELKFPKSIDELTRLIELNDNK